MRLLVTFEALKDQSYEKLYHHKFQGFIYNLIRDTEYRRLHDMKKYKFFCFSNIYPIKPMKEHEKRNWIVSSPDSGFIKILYSKLNEMKERGKEVRIGEYLFRIKELKMLRLKIKKRNLKLITATPIIIRIPRYKYEKYGIKSKRKYEFWRPSHNFEAFVNQLEGNIFKKWKEFHSKEIDEFPLFEIYRFRKSVSNHLVIDGNEIVVIGSLWEFHFSRLSQEQKKILEFAVDCGFGERNTYGFGFVNLKSES